MIMDIEKTIIHIKMRKMTPFQQALINQIEVFFKEVQQNRIEINVKPISTCPNQLSIRKKIVVRCIVIRNEIKRLLQSHFATELLTAKKRYIIEKVQTPAWFSEFDKFVFEECVHLCELRKVSTGIDWHVDHMIALRGKLSSGLHCGLNFQVIPAYINLMKNNKSIMQNPFEWLQFI